MGTQPTRKFYKWSLGMYNVCVQHLCYRSGTVNSLACNVCVQHLCYRSGTVNSTVNSKFL